MSDARRPRHEARDGDDSSSNWKELYAALSADPSRQPRRRRRAADDDAATEQPDQPDQLDQLAGRTDPSAAAEPDGTATGPTTDATVSEPGTAEPASDPEAAEPASEPEAAASDSETGTEPPATSGAPRRGRHSAPDDDETDQAVDVAVDESYRPRRWRPDTDEVPVPADTTRPADAPDGSGSTDATAAPVPEDATGPIPAVSGPPVPLSEETAADLSADPAAASTTEPPFDPAAQPSVEPSADISSELTAEPAEPSAEPSAEPVEPSADTSPRSGSSSPWPPHLTGPEFGEPAPDDVPQQPADEAAMTSSQEAAARHESAGDFSSEPTTDPVELSAPQTASSEASTEAASSEPPTEAAPTEAPASEARESGASAPGPVGQETWNPAPSSPAAASAALEGDGSTRPGSRHAAESSRSRVPVWLWAVIGVVVIALAVWLVVGLTGGDDDTAAPPPSESATSSASPTSMNIAELQPILCTGQSYAFLDTGLSADEMLADPGTLETEYPEAQLATVPGGCIEGSTTADEVVLALGPYNSLEETCSAVREIQGVEYTAYTGSADTGLKEASCP